MRLIDDLGAMHICIYMMLHILGSNYRSCRVIQKKLIKKLLVQNKSVRKSRTPYLKNHINHIKVSKLYLRMVSNKKTFIFKMPYCGSKCSQNPNKSF